MTFEKRDNTNSPYQAGMEILALLCHFVSG